jgi:sarcosine oxidase
MSVAGNRYDVIVAGIGAMGSAACYHLARRGKRVLGLERFGIPHTMGSSHGVNRIIRLAYYEDPSYVPLLRRAFELWRSLESEFGEQLLVVTGSIDASHPGSRVFSESLRSCEIHGLDHETMTGAELHARFPGIRLPDHYMALLQPDGGFVMSERAIVAHVSGALAAGAGIHGFEPVMSWTTTSAGVRVETERGVYEADQLIISAGAWMGKLVDGLAPLVQPERQVLGWFQPLKPELFGPARLPVVNLEAEDGRYYSFPVYGIPGFKFGKYHHRDEQIDPDMWDRNPNPADEEVLREGIRSYFPDADGPVLTMSSCIFTNTPDEHFVVDRLEPGSPVVVASPCSGHGYKFAAVIGEILADLAVQDNTTHDISLFRLDRFAAAARG